MAKAQRVLRNPMQEFFNVILKSVATFISSAMLLITGATNHSVPPTPEPASVVVAVAPTAQNSGGMISTPAPVSSTTVAYDLAPVSVTPTKITAAMPIFAPEPTAVAASPNTAAGISKNYVDEQLQILRNSLSSEIFKYSSTQFPNAPGISQYTASLAVSQRIDQLSNVAITNATVHGVSGLTAADIPTGITASNYLPLSGGTLSGAINVNGFSTLAGLFSTASSTIGNGTATGGLTISGGATTTGNVYFAGNVGIGATSPQRKLHIVGTDGPAAAAPTLIGGRDFLLIENNANVNIGLIAGAANGSAIKFYASGGAGYDGIIEYHHATRGLGIGVNQGGVTNYQMVIAAKGLVQNNRSARKESA